MIDPKDALLNGAKILEPLLLPRGFEFQFRDVGRGSGGRFAWGEFVRKDRRLELHFRRSLGPVRYHVGKHNATHECYMRELGVSQLCEYPGFSEDPRSAFQHLAQDLRLAEDFLGGRAIILRQAATKEAAETARREADLTAGAVGDRRKLEQLRSHFRGKRFLEVLALARDLVYPDRMTEAERRMVEIARMRTQRWKSPANGD